MFFSAARLSALVYALALIGGIIALRIHWIPQEGLQTAVWWIAQIFLGFLAVQALIAVFAVGRFQRKFRKQSRDFSL